MNRALKILSAPVRLLAKAWNLMTLHRSGWFLGLTSVLRSNGFADLKREVLQNPYGLRSYLNITGAIASIPLVVQRMEGDDLVEDPDHELLQLLRRPNPRQTKRQFFAEMIEHLWFGGELFFYAPDGVLTGRQAGKPQKEGLYLIRPDRVGRIEADPDTGVPTYYHWTNRKGVVRKTPAARMRHIYLIEDPEREGRGFPMADAIYRSVRLMRDGEAWNASIAQAKGRLPGFFKYKGPGVLGDEQFKKTKAEFQEAYSKDAENSRPGLLEGDFDFMPASTSVRDADWTEGDRSNLRKIGIGLGTDPSLLGDSANKTYSNFREARRAFYVLSVLPLLDWLMEQFTEWFLPWWETDDSAVVTYNRDAIDALQDELGAKYERMIASVAAGLTTRNEAREELGWEAAEDPLAGELTVPINTVPLASVFGGGDITRLSRRLEVLSKSEFDQILARTAGGDGFSLGHPALA